MIDADVSFAGDDLMVWSVLMGMVGAFLMLVI